MPTNYLADFSERLIAWQQRQGRHDLPWQLNSDPYCVWLSEIMLQQTQVSAVIPYYQRFLERFPDVVSLAGAADEVVMAAWAGLGYYARARNLLACARVVARDHGGKFPQTAEALSTLPGIGRSTAAAIAAFCFGQKAAILDGNVKRVLCRHFAVEGFPGSAPVERKLWALAESLLPVTGIASYTQGLMDLGATLCTRGKPRCPECPLNSTCLAREQGRQRELPMAKPRADLPERETTMLLITDGERLLLRRRPPSGLWGGLLVPPEGNAADVLAGLGLRGSTPKPLPNLLHSFTHFRLHIHPVLCMVNAPDGRLGEEDLQWIPLAIAAETGVPTPVGRLIRTLQQSREFRPADS